MAADDRLPCVRSSGRAPRTYQEILKSDQRPIFGRKKAQAKSVSDKLVWFSPVHSPLMSPAREKPVVKKKVRQSSIFSIQSKGKGSMVGEEPTSPKVSCIGQVRGHKKNKDPLEDAFKKKSYQSRLGSMSPARFFASPGRPSKWGALFGSRKDNSPSLGNGGGDNCATDRRTTFQTDKMHDFLSRCPDLFQERRTSDHLDTYQATSQGTDGSKDSRFEERGICAITNKCTDATCSEKVISHAFKPALFSHVSQKKVVGEVCGSALVMKTKKSEIHRHTDVDKFSSMDYFTGTIPTSKPSLNYEDLPSLHCGAYIKQNTKISVDVVPETWLWRNGETLRPDRTSHLICDGDRNICTRWQDLQSSQLKELNMTVSAYGDSLADTRNEEQCVDYQTLSGQFHAAGLEPAIDNNKKDDCVVEASFKAIDGSLCKVSDARKKTMNGAEHTTNSETICSQVTESPSRMHVAAVKENRKEFRGVAYGARSIPCVQSETNQPHTGKLQVPLEKSRSENEVDENEGGKESTEVNLCHQTLRKIGVDVGGVSVPHVVPSRQSNEDGKQFWSMFKGHKAKACSEQPFSALILVGYDQLTSSKNVGCQDEELFRGILEISRFSLHGSGKLFQVLNNDAAFNRSRSATSVRTVVRLQRCNSDPCRPS